LVAVLSANEAKVLQTLRRIKPHPRGAATRRSKVTLSRDWGDFRVAGRSPIALASPPLARSECRATATFHDLDETSAAKTLCSITEV
jgi:hypothetical protein